MTASRSRRCLQFAMLTLVTVLAAGCEPSGPPRYEVSGQVLYQGQLVPAGEITFRPDTSKGNSGPASFSMIHEGKYATLPDMGLVGGAYVVEIIGYDQPPAGEGIEGGQPLFARHTLEMNFPEEDAEIELIVPSQ